MDGRGGTYSILADVAGPYRVIVTLCAERGGDAKLGLRNGKRGYAFVLQILDYRRVPAACGVTRHDHAATVQVERPVIRYACPGIETRFRGAIGLERRVRDFDHQ
jgi:hypothetical protein